MSDKETTKVCKCGCTKLIEIRSQYLKLCPDCGTNISWYLDRGQKPLLG